MNIKTILTLITFTFAFALCTSAQEIKIKKDKVYLGKEHILNYEKINAAEISFYSLDNEEILYYRYNDNETEYNDADDYFTLNFIANDIKVKSRNWGRISSLGIKKAMQKLIKWLIKENVITKDGNVDSEKLNAFYDKYNE